MRTNIKNIFQLFSVNSLIIAGKIVKKLLTVTLTISIMSHDKINKGLNGQWRL